MKMKRQLYRWNWSSSLSYFRMIKKLTFLGWNSNSSKPSQYQIVCSNWYKNTGVHQGFSVRLRTRQLWRFSTGARDVLFASDVFLRRSLSAEILEILGASTQLISEAVWRGSNGDQPQCSEDLSTSCPTEFFQTVWRYHGLFPLTKYIWPHQSSLFFLQFGDRVFKTFLGGGHLLPGSPECLQHSVHAGEESRWAESVHQQLSVVTSSTAVSVAPHKKCFRLESGRL